MSRDRLYAILFILIPVIYFLTLPISTGDLAIWIALGRANLQQFSILTNDYFSILKTTPMVYPILTTYIYGILDSIGGIFLVSLFHKLILAWVTYLIYQNSVHRTEKPWTILNMLLMILSFTGASLLFIDRPATLALLPFIIAYSLIENLKKSPGRKDWIILICIMVLWVNLHGSWPLLLIMLGWKLSVLSFRSFNWNFIKKSAAGFFCVLLSSLLNPFGYKIFEYVFETGLISRKRNIDEWYMTDFTIYFPQGLFFYFMILTVIFLIFRKRLFNSGAHLLSSPFVPLLLLGVFAVRNTGLPFLALLPFCQRYRLLNSATGSVIENRRTNTLIFCTMLALLCFSLPYFKKFGFCYLPYSKGRMFDDDTPIKAVDFIEASNDRGPIFNEWIFGSYLTYTVSNKIFIDTRNIIYSDEDFLKYLQIKNLAPGWRDILNQYHFSFILLRPGHDEKLIDALNHSLDWKLVHKDEISVLFQAVK